MGVRTLRCLLALWNAFFTSSTPLPCRTKRQLRREQAQAQPNAGDTAASQHTALPTAQQPTCTSRPPGTSSRPLRVTTLSSMLDAPAAQRPERQPRGRVIGRDAPQHFWREGLCQSAAHHAAGGSVSRAPRGERRAARYGRRRSVGRCARDGAACRRAFACRLSFLAFGCRSAYAPRAAHAAGGAGGRGQVVRGGRRDDEVRCVRAVAALPLCCAGGPLLGLSPNKRPRPHVWRAAPARPARSLTLLARRVAAAEVDYDKVIELLCTALQT